MLEKNTQTYIQTNKHIQTHTHTHARTSYSRIILPIPTRGEVHIYIGERRRNETIPCVLQTKSYRSVGNYLGNSREMRRRRRVMFNHFFKN